MKSYFLFIFTLLYYPIFCYPNKTDTIKIAIAATSDMHGHIYPWDYSSDEEIDAGYARTDTVVQKLKNEYPNTLLIDVGDLFQDNLAEIFINNDTHPMVQALNLLKYDVWVPGNHDFNHGLNILERNIQHFNGKVICSNIKYEDSGKNYLPPYHIFDVNGVRVAIIGAVSPHIKIWEAANPDHYKNLDFLNPLDSLKQTVKNIEGQYDILVGAVHISRNGEYEYEGKSGAFQIAQAIPEFDVIFAGHEHVLYSEYFNDTDTWVLEPKCYGSHVAIAKFDLEKDEKGQWKLTSKRAENNSTEGFKSSEEVMKEFKWVHDISIDYINKVIGEIKSDFINGVDYITGKDIVTTMPRAQIEDTALMDFINEVQSFYAKSEISTAALFNVDQNVKKGPLKRRDIIKIFKYENTLRGINIKGENLLKYMEINVGYYQTIKEGDVTIAFNPKYRPYNYDMFSGINYDIDISQPEGSRIKNATINGKPLDKNATYRLATNDHRLGQLINYKWVSNDDIYYNSVNDFPSTIRDYIIKYIQEELNGEIVPFCDHNWKIIGLPKSFNDPETIEKIKNGEIEIPWSDDGRTPNVKSIRKDTINLPSNKNSQNSDLIKGGLISLIILFLIAYLMYILKK